MPKRRTINYDRVKELTAKGISQTEIGKEFDVTRQRISQVQAEIRNAGDPSVESKPAGRPRGRKTTSIKADGQPTWEQVKDFVITAIEKANRVPELEAELKRYKLGYDNALLQLKEHDKDKDEQRRYKIALQQGQVNPPLSSNFTEHIKCNGLYAPEFSYDKCLPHNITLEALLFSMEYNISQPVSFGSSNVPKVWYNFP